VTPTSYLTLNGRTALWRTQVGDTPLDWALGRGVGATGTAAERARLTLLGKKQLNSSTGGTVVNSGFLAMVNDVGIVGLCLLLVLFARLLRRGWKLGRSGHVQGWGAAGILSVMMLDALSRESLTGFPTAYIGMFLVGLGVAAAADEQEAAAAPATS